jgi:glycosyltransferase involved in cell wall biosynthesis
MINIYFIHEAPTPHNSYLLDSLAKRRGINLFRYYLYDGSGVPGRPWKSLVSGELQKKRIVTGINRIFSPLLVWRGLFDSSGVFFVVGWNHLSLIILLLIVGIRKRPLLMWDDGPTEYAVNLIKKRFSFKQSIKRTLINFINLSPGFYFYTGKVAKKNIINIGVLEKKLFQLPFFVKHYEKSLDIRSIHSCGDNEVLIFAGGRLIYQKGFDILIKALGEIYLNGCIAWKLVLAGSGPEESFLHELVESLGLEKNIDFLSWIEPDSFGRYVHSCDIFVAPARFDRFPTTIIAAMQASVPVVATDSTGSAIEFIENEENGFIVPTADVSALSKVILNLIEHPEIRAKVGLAGKKTIEPWGVEYGVNLILEKSMEALNQCVG